MRNRLLRALVFTLACATALADQGPPLSLWDLIGQADVIVLARVGTLQTSEEAARLLLSHKADEITLDVIETWKGKSRDRITVAVPTGIVCPYPPRYDEGETVVAFLAALQETSLYRTVDFANGCLSPGPGEVNDLRKAILGGVVLQSKGESDVPARVGWLLETASPPATRWYGLHGLPPRETAMPDLFDQSPRAVREALADRDLQLLIDPFIATPTCDVTLPMLLEIVGDSPSPELDRVAASIAEGWFADPSLSPGWAPSVLGALVRRHGRQPDWTLEDTRDGERFRDIWDRWMETLGLHPDSSAVSCPAPGTGNLPQGF